MKFVLVIDVVGLMDARLLLANPGDFIDKLHHNR